MHFPVAAPREMCRNALLQAAASAIAQASTPAVAQAQATAIAQAYASGKPDSIAKVAFGSARGILMSFSNPKLLAAAVLAISLNCL